MSKSTRRCLLLQQILLLCLEAHQTATAITPVCSAPLYDGAGNIITVVCTTDDVYTQASCHFLFQTDGSTETTKLWPPVNTVGPYNTCKLTIPAKNLTAGSHRFKVLMLLTANGIEYEPDTVESNFTTAILIPSSVCHPAEKGKPYTFKLTIPTLPDGNTIVWEDQVDPKCTCTAGIPDCFCKEGYQGTLFPNGFGGYVSTFIINQVAESHDGTTWTCRKIKAVFSCHFQVYLIPINPICEAPILHENGSLSITCMADDIYPQAACHFFHRTNGSLIEEMPPTVNMTGPPYSCTLTTVISQQGIHEFQVKMSPVIYGQEYSRGGLSQSDFTLPVVIEPPNVILAEECPCSVAFVLRNTILNCTCLRIDSSDLPTTIVWNNTDVSDSINTNPGLLSFTPSTNNIGFTCTATNSLGWTSSVDLKLRAVIQDPPAGTASQSESVKSQLYIGLGVGVGVGGLVIGFIIGAVICCICPCKRRGKNDCQLCRSSTSVSEIETQLCSVNSTPGQERRGNPFNTDSSMFDEVVNPSTTSTLGQVRRGNPFNTVFSISGEDFINQTLRQSAGSEPSDGIVPEHSVGSGPHNQTVLKQFTESGPYNETVSEQSARSRPHDQTVPNQILGASFLYSNTS